MSLGSPPKRFSRAGSRRTRRRSPRARPSRAASWAAKRSFRQLPPVVPLGRYARPESSRWSRPSPRRRRAPERSLRPRAPAAARARRAGAAQATRLVRSGLSTTGPARQPRADMERLGRPRVVTPLPESRSQSSRRVSAAPSSRCPRPTSEVEGRGQPEDRIDERALAVDPVDERLRDLEHVDREVAQMAERRVPRAEVVQRETNTEAA